MDSMNFEPNSHKSKAEIVPSDEKRVGKVVQGAVKTRKKKEISKLAGIFISEDVKNVKSYVFMDVLVPAIKKAISDIVTDGIDMLLYGGSGRSKKGPASKISYRSYYDRRDDDRHSPSDPRVRSGFEYEDIVFTTRGDAEVVLEMLAETIDRYKFATVSDLYDACGRTAPYTSNRYGWTNVRTADVARVRDGYIIRLPKAMPIDN